MDTSRKRCHLLATRSLPVVNSEAQRQTPINRPIAQAWDHLSPPSRGGGGENRNDKDLALLHLAIIINGAQKQVIIVRRIPWVWFSSPPMRCGGEVEASQQG